MGTGNEGRQGTVALMKRHRALQLLNHMMDHSISELERNGLDAVAGEIKELREYVERKLE